MIRLIASDIDGTLLPEGTTKLDPVMFELIRAFHRKGVVFAAASGRGFASVNALFADVADRMVYIVENGAYAMADGKTLFCRSLPNEVVNDVAEFARHDASVRFFMHAGPVEQYTESKDETFISGMEQGYGITYHRVANVLDIPEKDILKCALYTDSDAAGLGEKAEKLFGGRASVTVSGAHWVDINAKGTGKGYALKALQEYYGIDRADTVAFGDNLNDISMLEAAGISYAVEEAREQVKACADHIAGKMEEGAVVKILQNYLEQMQKTHA